MNNGTDQNPIVDNDDASGTASSTPDLASLFVDFADDTDGTKEAEEAGKLLSTVALREAPAIQATQTRLDPSQLKGRVALGSILIDNTPSMGQILYALALMGHDQLLDLVGEHTADDPVTVLVTAWLLNQCMSAPDGVVYPYTPIANAPRFGNKTDQSSYHPAIRRYPLDGTTYWFDRYAAFLTALATQVSDLEVANKAVDGLAILLTDGWDMGSQTGIDGLAQLIRSFRRMKNIFPIAIYCGELPKSGQQGYERARMEVLRALDYMGLDNPELRTAELEDMVRGIFIAAGFDPKFIYLPGDDLSKIVAVFKAVSKLYISVSKGTLPTVTAI